MDYELFSGAFLDRKKYRLLKNIEGGKQGGCIYLYPLPPSHHNFSRKICRERWDEGVGETGTGKFKRPGSPPLLHLQLSVV